MAALETSSSKGHEEDYEEQAQHKEKPVEHHASKTQPEERAPRGQQVNQEERNSQHKEQPRKPVPVQRSRARWA